MSDVESIPVAEFHARLKAQGAPTREDAAFVCPVCSTVQSINSLIDAGLTPEVAETRIGFSCEGRVRGSGPWPSKPTAKRRAMRGCDWSLGGLFTIHRLEVVDDAGKTHPMFEIAAPEQAIELASKEPTQ